MHCRVDSWVDERNFVSDIVLAQSEALKVLCAEGSIRSICDTRGEAYAAYYPAFPAELGLKSGQKWCGIHAHGGADKTLQLAQTSHETWRAQFRAQAAKSLSMRIVLCPGHGPSTAGDATGDVHTCVKWNVVMSSTFEGRLLELTGAWSPIRTSQLSCLARSSARFRRSAQCNRF